MLSNEKFALECRRRYAEDGLVVDQRNGEFAHCPLPKGLGETGYYLLHDDHQWQGLLQSRDVGRRCFWVGDAKQWLLNSSFVEGYFELWDIFEEFISGVHNGHHGKSPSEETRRKISEAVKGLTRSEETRKKISRAKKEVPIGPMGVEHKRKISKASKGRTHSEATKLKISGAAKRQHQEKPHSDESRRKMSEAAKRQHTQRWMCTVTGYITTPAPLSMYQKKRGIDPSNRIRLE